MTATTLTLAAFLAERLAEDEAAALGAPLQSSCLLSGHLSLVEATHIARHDPARVLAEVAAKRAVLGEHEGSHNCTRYVDPDDNPDCTTLRHLAAVYSDHPDYDESWRP